MCCAISRINISLATEKSLGVKGRQKLIKIQYFTIFGSHITIFIDLFTFCFILFSDLCFLKFDIIVIFAI